MSARPARLKPYYGAGFEFPHDFDQDPELSAGLAGAPVVEIIPEGFFNGRRRELLRRLAVSGKPVVVHSVEMSLGADEPFRQRHFDDIRRVIDEVNCIFYSDHICMTGAHGVEIGQLTTLPFTPEVQDVFCRNVDRVRAALGSVPLMFENITHRFRVPHSTLSEPDFLNGITRRTGAGLLLDVTNLYINSVNFGFDPAAFIAALDGKSVAGFHIAGGEWEEGKLYDTHSQPAHPEVWELVRLALRHTDPQVLIVEWDQNPPPVEGILDEVRKAATIYAEERRLVSAPTPLETYA